MKALTSLLRRSDDRDLQDDTPVEDEGGLESVLIEDVSLSEGEAAKESLLEKGSSDPGSLVDYSGDLDDYRISKMEYEYFWDLALRPEYRTEEGGLDQKKMYDQFIRDFPDKNIRPGHSPTSAESFRRRMGGRVRTYPDHYVHNLLGSYKNTLPLSEAFKETELSDLLLFRFQQSRKRNIEASKERSGNVQRGVSWNRPDADGFSELFVALNLDLDPEFRLSKKMRNASKIADALNSHFHKSKTLRKASEISRFFSRYYSKNAFSAESLEEDGLFLDAFVPREMLEINGISEEAFAWDLAMTPEYRTEDGRRDLDKICDELNRHFHDGRIVRNAAWVNTHLSSYRLSLPEDEALKENKLRYAMKRISNDRWILAEETKNYHGFSEDYFIRMALQCPEYWNDESGVDSEKIALELNKVFNYGFDLRRPKEIETRLAYKKDQFTSPLTEKLSKIPEARETDPRDVMVLSSIDSLAKQGVYNRLGIPVKFVLDYLREDLDEKEYRSIQSYILRLFQTPLVLDNEYSYIIETSSLSQNRGPVNYIPKHLFGNVLKLSEDNRHITWSPLETAEKEEILMET